MVVLGRPPERAWARPRRCSVEVDGRRAWEGAASTVVIANGEYLRGLDLVPRGHPGDGRLEVQVHAVRGRQRRALRARLRTGTHLPHPDVRVAQGRSVRVRWDRPMPVEVDRLGRGRRAALGLRVRPGAILLVP
jgi:diacylglycerol kinase family enzyme